MSPSFRYWSRLFAPIVLILLLASGFTVGLVVPTNTALARPSGNGPIAATQVQGVNPAASNSTNAGITICGPQTRTLTSTTGFIPVAGNFTVCNKAIVTIENADLLIESQTGTSNFRLADDLAFRFHLNVSNGAQLRLLNASINTSVGAGGSFASYPKLNLSVTNGSMLSASDGTLDFAGWIYVGGGSAGGSTLYLNSSTIRANHAVPVGNSNYSQDNAYAPQITVNGGSTVVSTNSTVQSYYADPLALTSTLNENFVSSAVQSHPVVIPGVVKGFTVPNIQALIQDTYPTWSAGILTGVINVTANGTLTPTFETGGHNFVGKTLVVSKGNMTNFSEMIPGSTFVQPYMNPEGLSGLLNSMMLGNTNVTFTGTGAGKLNSVVLSMVPLFDFNITFASGSQLYAVDSTFDVNYANSTCVIPADSNKLFFLGGSQGDLLNSSSYLTWLNQTVPSCGEQDAFEVDASSSYWVYDWARVTALGTTGAPLPGAQVQATSMVSNSTISALANASSNPSLFPAIFRAAVDSVAAPVAQYGVTQQNGQALLALGTSYVTLGSLPDGLYVGGLYNVTFNGKLTYLNGSSVQKGSGFARSPPLCGWPRSSAGCGLTILAPVSLELFTANVQVQSISLGTQGVFGCTSSCYVFEGNSVDVNVTVDDVNNLIVADQQAIPVYVYDLYGTTNTTLGEMLYNFDISSPAQQSQSISVTIPYSDSGSHTIQVVVDPMHVAPENGTIGKTMSLPYNVYKAPQILPSEAVITVYDACNGQPITLALANTCNRVNIDGTVTNTGDAGVTATLSLSWNGSTPIGVPVSRTVPAGGSATVNGSLLITTSTFLGAIQMHVETPLLPPITYNRVFFNISQTASFEDYTTLVLNNPSANFTLQSVGANGQLYSVAGATYTNSSGTFKLNASEVAQSPQYSPFGVGTGIGATAIMENVGGATSAANATLYLQNSSRLIPVSERTLGAIGYSPTSVDVLMPIWHINSTVIGSNVGLYTFDLVVRWSNTYIYGVENFNFSYSFNVYIRPPSIQLSPVSFTPTKVDLSATSVPELVIQTTATLVNPYVASMYVSYVDKTLGSNCTVSAGSPNVQNGTSPLPSFRVPLTCLQPGTYSLVLKFTLLGNTTYITAPALQNGVVAYVPAVSQASFLQQYWLWLVIAAIAVVAVALVLFFFRRLGRGNLVECGECGELIPESAVACPKCGAEFEKELMRCSRCGASIPSNSSVCPDCSALLVGLKPDPMAADYNTFTQRFRVVAQKELAENYNEGAFWDWWKRQPTYVPFTTWKQQMAVSGATGGSAPDAAAAKMKGRKGQGGAPPQAQMGQPMAPSPPSTQGQRMPQQPPATEAPPAGPTGPAGPGMKACPSCGRSINESMLLCPFCGAVTR